MVCILASGSCTLRVGNISNLDFETLEVIGGIEVIPLIGAPYVLRGSGPGWVSLSTRDRPSDRRRSSRNLNKNWKKNYNTSVTQSFTQIMGTSELQETVELEESSVCLGQCASFPCPFLEDHQFTHTGRHS